MDFARTVLRRIFGSGLDSADRIRLVVDRVALAIQAKLDEANARGELTAAALPVYRSLVYDTGDLLVSIARIEPFASQLREVRVDDNMAVLAAYNILIFQRFWDLGQAFGSDHRWEERLGLELRTLGAEFIQATGFDNLLLLKILQSSESTLNGMGGGIDFRPVLDRNLLDLLQTLTDGRYTVEHWKGSDLMQLMAGTGEVMFVRLGMWKAVKEGLGLDGALIGRSPNQ